MIIIYAAPLGGWAVSEIHDVARWCRTPSTRGQWALDCCAAGSGLEIGRSLCKLRQPLSLRDSLRAVLWNGLTRGEHLRLWEGGSGCACVLRRGSHRKDSRQAGNRVPKGPCCFLEGRLFGDFLGNETAGHPSMKVVEGHAAALKAKQLLIS